MTCDNQRVQVPAGRRVESIQLLYRLQAKHPFPLTVLLALTERCHLKCEHCFVPSGVAPEELSYSEVESLLDELAALGVLFLTITGGDPTLRRDLEGIVAAAVERRFFVRLKTSATLLDEPRVDALVEAGLGEIHVSLYDDRPDVHDAVVGSSGAWNRSLRAMRLFAAKGVVVKMAALVMNHNAERIGRLVDMCEELGFQYTVDPRVFPRSDGNLVPVALRSEEEQLAKLMQDARLYDLEHTLDATPRHPDEPPCAAGRGAAYLQSDGRVSLCPMLPMVLGNIRDQSFHDIWLESEDRRRIVEMTWSDLPECSSCKDSWACTRCGGIALLEAGDLCGASRADCAIAKSLVRARASYVRR